MMQQSYGHGGQIELQLFRVGSVSAATPREVARDQEKKKTQRQFTPGIDSLQRSYGDGGT